MEILETKNLSKVYGSKIAVKQINLQVQQRSLTAFLGPNGAGKSTTIKMLTGLLNPSGGSILFEGRPTNQVNFLRQIGLVFQESLLDERLSVKENLVTRAQIYEDVKRQRVDQLIELVDAKSFENQLYGSLSGGQKRRVDIARALLNQPKILFLDEPTTGLDIQTRSLIWQLLERLQQEENLTIFLTTHYLEEADQADQIYILDHGEIIAAGSANELKQQYAQNKLVVWAHDSKQLQKYLTAQHLHWQGDEFFKIMISSPKSALEILRDQADNIADFTYQKGTMDDVFLNLTGKEIR
ncbi:ABC transporter ATP-binding protein [Xylocopilactobacillus apicola]|uniref:ABC transporter ATP-binding protein n=1 Tax=Xylocopilactobacillus apicola TaxID=2932184 RepID=A0AAU9DVT6_9LACO|nr:ABC transporter ATP-binding protein [Xylocopilactobacillus apicola]BDR58023.1 ABC transporter ATP-binding protein [Xylocopilactobacillus apicola]